MYFFAQLGSFLAFIGLCLCKQALSGGRPNPPWFAAPLIAAWVWSVVCLDVKRLHDLDYRGHWAWLKLVPVLNLAVAGAMLFVIGTPGPNRFGHGPGQVSVPGGRVPVSFIS